MIKLAIFAVHTSLSSYRDIPWAHDKIHLNIIIYQSVNEIDPNTQIYIIAEVLIAPAKRSYRLILCVGVTETPN